MIFLGPLAAALDFAPKCNFDKPELSFHDTSIGPESDIVLLSFLLILSEEFKDSTVFFDNDTLVNVIPGGSFFDKLFSFPGVALFASTLSCG